MGKAELVGRSSAYKLGEAELELERCGDITKAPSGSSPVACFDNDWSNCVIQFS